MTQYNRRQCIPAVDGDTVHAAVGVDGGGGGAGWSTHSRRVHHCTGAILLKWNYYLIQSP